MNNDILNIISEYADLDIHYNRDRLVIERERCKACRGRIIFTNRTLTEVYLFPEIIKISFSFLYQAKYIRERNILFFYENRYNTFSEAERNGIIRYTGSRSNECIYGRFLELIKPAKIYAKRPESISGVFYSHINDNYKLKEYLDKFKYFKNDGVALMNIIYPILVSIDIDDFPHASMEHLCFSCRKKYKKGYIFV